MYNTFDFMDEASTKWLGDHFRGLLPIQRQSIRRLEFHTYRCHYLLGDVRAGLEDEEYHFTGFIPLAQLTGLKHVLVRISGCEYIGEKALDERKAYVTEFFGNVDVTYTYCAYVELNDDE
jgi:hypothetical protein